MARKKRRRRVSFGTIFMLLLTILVVAGCAVFVMAIAGEDLYEKTGDLISSIAKQGFLNQAENTPEPQGTEVPAAALMDIPAGDGAQSLTPSPSPTPVKAASTFTLAAAGAVYAPKAIRQSVQENGDHYDFTSVFSGLGDALSCADLGIVTLETTTAGSDKGYGNFNTPAEILDALRASGADLVALATERALDKGYEGLEITVSELNTRGMTYAGVNLDGSSAARTNLINIGGVKVAVLAYTYGLSDEGKSKTRDSERSAVNLIDTAQMVSDITRARVDGANVVIVLPHWGTKNKQEIPANLRGLAKTLAEAGADVILGTHPNVVQGTERMTVTRSDGLLYETVVCYSLGSLLTDARTDENTAGMIARLSITYDPGTRRTTLGELVCTPVYIARQRENDENVYRVVDTDNSSAVAALTESERQAAQKAASLVREVTGQQQREEEGQG